MGRTVNLWDIVSPDDPRPIYQAWMALLKGGSQLLRNVPDDHQTNRAVHLSFQLVCQGNAVPQPILISAAQMTFYQQNAVMVLRKLLRAIHAELVQVHAVVNHHPGRNDTPVNGLPPGARKVALVNNAVGDAAANKSQNEIIGFGAQKMADTGETAAVDPIHPIQALNNTQPAPPGLQQIWDAARPANDENYAARRVIRVGGNRHTSSLKTGNQARPK